MEIKVTLLGFEAWFSIHFREPQNVVESVCDNTQNRSESRLSTTQKY